MNHFSNATSPNASAKGFAYEITHQGDCAHAATGKISTPHGTAETPAFIFCATHASIKAVETHALRELGVEIILANTYHLTLRPGAKRIAEAGGLHAFMGWDGPLLTDSGGYQIFAMGHGSVSDEIKRSRSNPKQKPSLLGITEEGAHFKSYVDGQKIFLSPESAMDLQHHLGGDFVVQLDECTPFHVSEAYTEAAMERSLRWAERSLLQHRSHQGGAQACYAVLQGGVHPHLRRRSATALARMGFFSLAVGGSLGQTSDEMHRVVSISMDAIREATYGNAKDGALTFPVHLLGVGDRRSIFHGVREGIATFDCVSPTRLARHGHAIMPCAVEPSGVLNLHNARHRNDDSPLDRTASYHGSRLYTRAYLHHLLKAKELSAHTILSKHNIAQMTRMMKNIREGIRAGKTSLEEYERYWNGKLFQ